MDASVLVMGLVLAFAIPPCENVSDRTSAYCHRIDCTLFHALFAPVSLAHHSAQRTALSVACSHARVACAAGRKSRNREPLEAANTVTIEVTAWPQPCDAAGTLAPLSDPAWTPPEGGLPRRDAGLFLRALRRHARLDKLDAICADVGESLVSAPPEAQFALWYAVNAACNTALAAVEAQGLEPKDGQVCLVCRLRPLFCMYMCSSACLCFVCFAYVETREMHGEATSLSCAPANLGRSAGTTHTYAPAGRVLRTHRQGA